MIVPVYCNIQKAEDIAEKGGCKGDECAQIRPVRRLQLEHHDRDNDGDHTVAECFQPAFVQRIISAAQSSPLPSGLVAGTSPRQTFAVWHNVLAGAFL